MRGELVFTINAPAKNVGDGASHGGTLRTVDGAAAKAADYVKERE